MPTRPLPHRLLALLSLGALAPAVRPHQGLEVARRHPERAVALLRRHKVLQLAAHRLDYANGAEAELRAALQPAAALAARRTTAAQTLLAELPAVATNLDGAIVAMKGVAASEWYPGSGQRDVSDVDLWFQDAEHAAGLGGWLRTDLGYEVASFELPWFKRATNGGSYGVFMLQPPDDRLVHVDIHFGEYSVRHCASFPLRIPATEPGRAVPMLDLEDDLCCLVANVAGDHFVDLKTLNDLYLCLRRSDVDWDRVRHTLGAVGLLGFLGVVSDRLTDIFVVDHPISCGLDALGRIPRETPAPPIAAPNPRRRRRVTVRHAYRIGRQTSLLHAARLAVTAHLYYHRPLRLRLARWTWPGRAFRVRARPWTCTRLVPLPAARRLLTKPPASADRAASKPIAVIGRGLEVIGTSGGDVVRFGGELFLPTVYYRIGRSHARAAVLAAREPPTPTGNNPEGTYRHA